MRTRWICELNYALSFTERPVNVVEFTVADRDGDESPEFIRYAWSGTPGDPLTRQYNGGTIAELVRDVHLLWPSRCRRLWHLADRDHILR